MEETVDKLREIVWCLHLKITPRPIARSEVPHIFIHDQKCYMAVEEGKVKLVCQECWKLAATTFGMSNPPNRIHHNRPAN